MFFLGSDTIMPPSSVRPKAYAIPYFVSIGSNIVTFPPAPVSPSNMMALNMVEKLNRNCQALLQNTFFFYGTTWPRNLYRLLFAPCLTLLCFRTSTGRAKPFS